MGEPTEAELKELEQEMRERSHQLANLLQNHTAELAGIKVIAERMTDVVTAVYGDLRSGTDTGLRGAVQRLYQEVRDTEIQRAQDRKREEEQWAKVIAQGEEQSRQIAAINSKAERRGGAFGFVREVGNTITVLAAAGGLIMVIVKMAALK